jgi:ribosome-binding protein aMBF1 (putative translation factor)
MASDAVAGPVFECVRNGNEGKACAAWLATSGATNTHVRAAAGAREVTPDNSVPRPDWPQLHAALDALLAAATEREAKPKIDPLVAALRQRREALGILQADTARRLQINAGLVRDDEAGRSNPPLSRLRAYADLYGLDLTVEAQDRP